MAERALSQRELNRALLARQLLLERVSLPIPRALERTRLVRNVRTPSGDQLERRRLLPGES